MDLLRRVQQARQEKGVQEPHGVSALPKPTSEFTRASIIEKKPKHKVLKQYFETLIQQAIDEEE
jgi:hypothetical protein